MGVMLAIDQEILRIDQFPNRATGMLGRINSPPPVRLR